MGLAITMFKRALIELADGPSALRQARGSRRERMLPGRSAAWLAALLSIVCAAMPLHADLHPLAIAVVESIGDGYFEPAGRCIVIRSQPVRLFIRIRNTSENAVPMRAHPENAYSIELKNQTGMTFMVERKKGTGGDAADDRRVYLSPRAERIIPMDIRRDTWEGVPDLEAGKESTYVARIVYETTDGQVVYSEPYKLVVSILESNTPFPRGLPAGGEESNKGATNDVEPTTSGTGWFCQGGYVVTCYHVVKGHKIITVVSGNLPRRKASVMTRDETNDLAVLKLDDDSNLPAGIPIGQRSLSLGEKVFTIGYPRIDLLGQSPKLSDGVVSSTQGMHDDPRTLQMSVLIQAGNSGGPLLDRKGEVVGVVQSKLSAVTAFAWTGDPPQNVNYAVKAAYVQPLIGNLPAQSAAPPLAAQEAEMADIVKRVQNSVVMILAE